VTGVGLHHFYELVSRAPAITAPFGSPDFFQQAAKLQQVYYAALLAEHQQVFAIAAVICAAGALVGLLTVAERKTAPSSSAAP
jgi:hypothetical protein